MKIELPKAQLSFLRPMSVVQYLVLNALTRLSVESRVVTAHVEPKGVDS